MKTKKQIRKKYCISFSPHKRFTRMLSKTKVTLFLRNAWIKIIKNTEEHIFKN